MSYIKNPDISFANSDKVDYKASVLLVVILVYYRNTSLITIKRRARSHGGRSRRRGFMEDIDDLVLAGHGGIVHHADVDVDPPDEKRRQALEARLKCEVIRIAEEAARGSGCRISPQVAQCLTELTMSYADQLADDLSAFAQHRKGKTVTHEDVLLAVRRIPAVRDSVQALLPSEKRKRQTTFNVS